MAILFLAFSWVCISLNILSVIIMIFFERKDIRSIQSWILAFLLLPPIFSLYIYFIFGCGPKLNKKKIEKRNYRIFNELEKIIDYSEYDSLPDDPNVDISIAKFNFLHNKSAITQFNDIKIFNTAYDKFEDLIKTIKSAKHTIHILYYIIKNDNIGNLLIDTLINKVKEGVKVRVIYDDVGCICVSKSLFKKLINAGGEVYPFFPSHLKFINLNLNYRNHRKIVVIDGKIGYVGGVNIGDEYMSLHKRLRPWKDCHIKIIGEAVNFLQLQFIQDLSYVSNHRIETEDNFMEKYFPKAEIQNRTCTQIVASGPDSKNYENIKSSYTRMIFCAKKELLIQSPYLSFDDNLLSAIISTAKSGVKVKIMIPRIYDKRIVYRASTSYINRLIESGVEVYLYDGFIHSKVIVMDDSVTSIGTANFNVRSFSLNFEINAFITDLEITRQVKEIFYEDINHSIKLDENFEKNKPLLVKLEESICRLFILLF